MATLNISIPDNMKEWVGAQIKNGKYSSASDYIRDLVRLDQRSNEALDNMLLEGLKSGQATELNMENIKKQARARLNNDRT